MDDSEVLSNILSALGTDMFEEYCSIGDIVATMLLQLARYEIPIDDINDKLSTVIDLLGSSGSVSSVAATVALDAAQFDQLMTLGVAVLVVLLFILAFAIAAFGVFLARILTNGWRV